MTTLAWLGSTILLVVAIALLHIPTRQRVGWWPREGHLTGNAVAFRAVGPWLSGEATDESGARDSRLSVRRFGPYTHAHTGISGAVMTVADPVTSITAP